MNKDTHFSGQNNLKTWSVLLAALLPVGCLRFGNDHTECMKLKRPTSYAWYRQCQKSSRLIPISIAASMPAVPSSYLCEVRKSLFPFDDGLHT